MKKKKSRTPDDLEIFIDPTPLTKEEEIGLSKFIKKLKAKAKKKLAA